MLEREAQIILFWTHMIAYPDPSDKRRVGFWPSSDPLLFCPEKRYSRHKQSAEFVAIKRPLKKSNQSLSLEGIFGGGEGARAWRPARVRLSSPGRRRAREVASSAGKNNCFVRSFVVDMS